MATPFLARFPTKKNAGCTNASHDFRPRKYNILLPYSSPRRRPLPPPKSVRAYERTSVRAYADVTTKISRMDGLPNFFLSYEAPLERAYAQKKSRKKSRKQKMRVYILIAPTGLRRIPLRLQNSRFFSHNQ